MGLELDAPSIQITNRSMLKCAHGGSVSIKISTSTTLSNGGRPAKWTDLTTVSGCPFRIGAKPQPCTKVHWPIGNPFVLVDGVPGLTFGSIGICRAANNVVQGPVVILYV